MKPIHLAIVVVLVAHVFVLCLIVFLVNNGSLPSWGSSLLPWLFVSVLALGLLAAFLMLSHVVPPHMWLSTHPDADRWSWTFRTGRFHRMADERRSQPI